MFGVFPESDDGDVDDGQLTSEVGVIDLLRMVSNVLDDQTKFRDGPTQDVDLLLDDVVTDRTVCDKLYKHTTHTQNLLNKPERGC